MMPGKIGPQYPPLPNPVLEWLFEALREMVTKMKVKNESESLEEKIKKLKKLQDEGLISETQCKETIEKILEAYSKDPAKQEEQ